MVAAERVLSKMPGGVGLVKAVSGMACAVAIVLLLALPFVSVSVITPHQAINVDAAPTSSSRDILMSVSSSLGSSGVFWGPPAKIATQDFDRINRSFQKADDFQFRTSRWSETVLGELCIRRQCYFVRT